MLHKMRRVKRTESGFTLIELLIVIVILGILAAVIVFAVGAFNNNGKTAACQSDFKSTEIAAEAYSAKNGAYPANANALLTPVAYLKQLHVAGVNGYTINVSTAGVTVTVGAATGGLATCDGLG